MPPGAGGHRRRCPAFLGGRAPRNKGMRYPPDPPRPEEIILVMRQAGDDRHGLHLRALIAVLWRGGLRISEARALYETDVDERRGSLRIRPGMGDKRREAEMDEWGFEQMRLWLEHRVQLPVGPLFCVIDGVTRGRAWTATAARGGAAPARQRGRGQTALRAASASARACRRTRAGGRRGQHHPAPLGHTDLGTTSTYLQGIDPTEVIDAIRSRRQPTISATAGLRL